MLLIVARMLFIECWIVVCWVFNSLPSAFSSLCCHRRPEGGGETWGSCPSLELEMMTSLAVSVQNTRGAHVCSTEFLVQCVYVVTCMTVGVGTSV